MRGYNSRHIVILMSVSLMIREFIKTMLMSLFKRCLCTNCYPVVWSVVPQGDVLFPITFQGEKQIWGLLYKVQVSGGRAQPLVE